LPQTPTAGAVFYGTHGTGSRHTDVNNFIVVAPMIRHKTMHDIGGGMQNITAHATTGTVISPQIALANLIKPMFICTFPLI